MPIIEFVIALTAVVMGASAIRAYIELIKRTVGTKRDGAVQEPQDDDIVIAREVFGPEFMEEIQRLVDGGMSREDAENRVLLGRQRQGSLSSTGKKELG